MACHEVAALRLALHTLLGDRPPHERTHEEVELSDVLTAEGALSELAGAATLARMREALDASALDLEQKVADMPSDHAQLGYHRALVVTVRRTQSDLRRLSAQITQLYQDLDDAHDLLHEVFPESD